MKAAAGIRTLSAIDWSRWQAVDPATLVFVLRESEILLIRKQRGLGAGKVNGPGGRLEPGESPEQCAVREAREELGITPTALRRAGENRFQFVDGYSIHVHVFAASGFRGTVTETAEAVPMWTPIDRIPYHEMWADDHLWLPHLLAGRAFSGRFVFEGDAMLDHELVVVEGSSPG